MATDKQYTQQQQQIRINSQITAKEVRVINDATNEQLGVIALDLALEKARELKLDLVEVSPNANPPVCRLIDFGKYRYREQKKINEAKAKQKKIQIKEIKLRPVTDEHDYQIKLRNAKSFLENGDKVKFIVQFRGREITHQEFGMRYLLRIIDELQNIITVENPPRLEGRNATMMIANKKK